MLPRGAEGGGRDTHEVLCCLTRRPGAMHPRARSFDLQRVRPETPLRTEPSSHREDQLTRFARRPPSAGVRGVPALLPARLRGAPEPRSPAERPSNPWQTRRNGGLRDAEVCARRQRHKQHAGRRSAAAGAGCDCSVGSSDCAAAALRDRNHRSPPADGSARQGSPAPCTARLGCARQVRRSSPIAATRCCPTSCTPARIACPRLARPCAAQR